MTESDYDKCYKELTTNLIGSEIKYLLSNKTVLFIGYSMEDEDFKKIWQFIDNSLGDLKPHYYIVSPDDGMKEKLKNKNVTVINTIGSNFIEKVRQQLIDDGVILNSDILYLMADAVLEVALNEHSKANTRYHKEKNSLLIYSILYQDGIIHSLKRILARQETGEYMNPEFINNSIYSYYYLFDKYMKQNRIFDAAYLLGYAHAMDFILYEYFQVSKGKKINSDNTICLYYLPRKKVYNNMNEFNKDINEFKTKKYINLANRIAEEFGGPDSGLEVHHIPFI